MKPLKLKDGFGGQAAKISSSEPFVHGPIPLVLVPSFLEDGSERGVDCEGVEKRMWARSKGLGLQEHLDARCTADWA